MSSYWGMVFLRRIISGLWIVTAHIFMSVLLHFKTSAFFQWFAGIFPILAWEVCSEEKYFSMFPLSLSLMTWTRHSKNN